MARIPFNTTIDERTRDKILELAIEKSQGRVIDEAVGLLAEGKAKHDLSDVVMKLDLLSRTVNSELVEQVAETLELVRSMPDPVVPIQGQTGDSGGSRSQQGAFSQPRRESGSERVQREKSEREQRARARSSVGDDPSISFEDDFVG